MARLYLWLVKHNACPCALHFRVFGEHRVVGVAARVCDKLDERYIALAADAPDCHVRPLGQGARGAVRRYGRVAA